MRYFKIYYIGVYGSSPFHGNIVVESKGYPNKDILGDELCDEMGYSDIAIIGVNEMPEEDYYDWLMTPEEYIKRYGEQE